MQTYLPYFDQIRTTSEPVLEISIFESFLYSRDTYFHNFAVDRTRLFVRRFLMYAVTNRYREQLWTAVRKEDIVRLRPLLKKMCEKSWWTGLTRVLISRRLSK